jgi:hypothetical protein
MVFEDGMPEPEAAARATGAFGMATTIFKAAGVRRFERMALFPKYRTGSR